MTDDLKPIPDEVFIIQGIDGHIYLADQGCEKSVADTKYVRADTIPAPETVSYTHLTLPTNREV